MEAPASNQPGWLDIPAAVRNVVTEKLGARVLGWTSLSGGLIAGGYELQLQAGGVNYYVKAAAGHSPGAFEMLRAELELVRALPAGAPTLPLVWTIDDEIGVYGRWIVLGFAMQPVRLPGLPWAEADVHQALELAQTIGDVVVPDPGTTDSAFPMWQEVFDLDGWTRIAKDHPGALPAFGAWLPDRTTSLADLAGTAATSLAGDRLGHNHLRREVVMLAVERGVIPPLANSWVLCSAGPAFASTVSLLGFMHAQGGPTPEQALVVRPLPGSYDDDEITGYLTVLAGHHAYASLQPPVPGSPLGRAAQREHARVLTDWLRRRLGW